MGKLSVTIGMVMMVAGLAHADVRDELVGTYKLDNHKRSSATCHVLIKVQKTDTFNHKDNLDLVITAPAPEGTGYSRDLLKDVAFATAKWLNAGQKEMQHSFPPEIFGKETMENSLGNGKISLDDHYEGRPQSRRETLIGAYNATNFNFVRTLYHSSPMTTLQENCSYNRINQ